MNYRRLGRTGLRVSEIGFGCGSVGGLLVRGDAPEQTRAVSRAIQLGINYFDTAPSYGDGNSETNLGRVLRELQADVFVGSKVRLSSSDLGDVAGAVRRSLINSLSRLQRDYVDLLQLHNAVVTQANGRPDSLTSEQVLASVVPALRSVQAEGLTRHIGFTGLGETAAVHQLVASNAFDTIQVYYNVLNPSAGRRVGTGFAGQDFREVIDLATANEMGVIVIRALAAGALSAQVERHRVAGGTEGALVAGSQYDEDLRRAHALIALARENGMTGPVELALRFVLSKAEVSTVLVGFSDTAQVEDAVRWTERGGLPEEMIGRLLQGARLAG